MVLGTFDRLLQNAPAKFDAVAMAQAVTVGAAGPREAISVFSRGQYIGPQSQLEAFVEPLVGATGAPAKATLKTMKYWDMQRMFAGAEGARHSFADISRYSAARFPTRSSITSWTRWRTARAAARRPTARCAHWVGSVLPRLTGWAGATPRICIETC